MDKGTSIDWKSISYEEKKKLQGIYGNFEKLWEFECKVNERLMIYLFGENLGKHYWDKFIRENDRNIMKLMKSMDAEKKGDLVANIFLNETLYANCN